MYLRVIAFNGWAQTMVSICLLFRQLTEHRSIDLLFFLLLILIFLMLLFLREYIFLMPVTDYMYLLVECSHGCWNVCQSSYFTLGNTQTLILQSSYFTLSILILHVVNPHTSRCQSSYFTLSILIFHIVNLHTSRCQFSYFTFSIFILHVFNPHTSGCQSSYFTLSKSGTFPSNFQLR